MGARCYTMPVARLEKHQWPRSARPWPLGDALSSIQRDQDLGRISTSPRLTPSSNFLASSIVPQIAS